MADSSNSSARVAIRIGQPSSARQNSRPRAHVSSNLGKRHRAHAGLDHDDSASGSEDEVVRNEGRDEAITGYGFDGASNHDMEGIHTGRSRSRSRQGESEHRRSHTSQDRDPRKRDSSEPVDKAGDEEKTPIQWGLNVSKRRRLSDEPAGVRRRSPTPIDNEGQGHNDSAKRDVSQKTADEEAMDALLWKKSQQRGGGDQHLNRSSTHDTRPEDYEEVPIENFGATLLTKYGWDGKMTKGPVKNVRPHANLTGLGAKNFKDAEELDAWSQKKPKDAKERRPPCLHEYRREQEKKRERREDRNVESYRSQRDRELEQERYRDRDCRPR